MKIIRIIIFLLVLFLFLPSLTTYRKTANADSNSWADTNYKYRIKVTIKFDDTFYWYGKNPIRIGIYGGFSNFWNNVNNEAKDIYITDVNGNELSYWIERWNYNSKEATIWINFSYVGIPGETTDAQIAYIYYGNPDATGKGWHNVPKPDYSADRVGGWFSGDGDGTFDFFDDFEGGEADWQIPADESKWNHGGTQYGDAFLNGSGKCCVSAPMTYDYIPNGSVAYIVSKFSPANFYLNFIWESRFATERDGNYASRQRNRIIVYGDFDTDGDGDFDGDDEWGIYAQAFYENEYYWGDYTDESFNDNQWYISKESCNSYDNSFTWKVYKEIGGYAYLNFDRDADVVGPMIDGKIEFHAGGESTWTDCSGHLFVDYVFVHKYYPAYSVNLLEQNRTYLGVLISSDKNEAYHTNPITYQVKLQNAEHFEARDVKVECIIPSNYEIDLSETSATAGSFTYNSDSNKLTWTVNSIPGYLSSEILTIKGITTAAGEAKLTSDIVYVRDYDSDDYNHAEKTVIVHPAANLSISKSAPSEVTAGTGITYTIDVTNSGPDIAENVKIIDKKEDDPFPEEIENPTFIYSTDGGINWVDGGEWTGEFVFSQPLSKDSTFSIQITGTVNPSTLKDTILKNKATVISTTKRTDGSDNNLTSDEVETTVITKADLLSIKIDGTDPVVAGETLTYTITITNNGPSDAQNVVLTDDIPDEILNPQFRYRISYNGGNTWGDWSDWSSWSSPYNLGTLPNGEKFEVEIKGTVDPSTPDGTTIYNEASVSSDTEDPYIDNNTHTENTDVITRADLSITKTLSKDTNLIETEIEYTIEVKNNGPSYARNVRVIDKIPEGLMFVSYTSTKGVYNPDTGVWSIGDMKDGEMDILKITLKVMDYNPIINTAEVVSDTTDTDKNNNKAISNKVIDVLDPLIKGTDTREGYFEFFVDRENKTWLLRIPDKGYTTGWMPFDSFNDSTCMSGTYEDKRYALFFTKCSEDKFNIAFFDKEKGIYIIYSPDLITIKGTATREGYFEFHVDRSLKQWIIIIPDKLYITRWMDFNKLRSTDTFMSGHYADRRYHLLFDWYSSGRYHLIFNDRRAGISIKFAGR